MWKIFYSDSAYCDQDGPPELAPKRDVQALAVADEVVGRRIERQSDFYIWTPERGFWRGVDQFGLFDYLIEPGFKVVLFGRTVADNDYRSAWQRAISDTYLPPKSARLETERAP